MKRINYKNWFRPIFEIRASIGWIVVSLLLLFSAFPFKWICSLLLVFFAVARGIQAKNLLAFRMNLSTRYLRCIEVADLYKEASKANKEKCLYLGHGYRWDQGSAQLATEILRMPKSALEVLPKRLPEFALKWFIPKNSIVDRLPIEMGQPWIKVLGEVMHSILWPLKAVEGHTLIAGATGAGKTRTYEVLSTQIIRRGSVLIIVDPKNDQEWRERVKRECRVKGRKFLYYSQAEPHKSIRLDPLANWNQSSEIASRISQLLDDGPFRQFANVFIDRVVKGSIYAGDRPNLRLIFRYVQGPVDTLLERCLKKFFVANEFTEFEAKAQPYMQKNAANGLLSGLVALYRKEFAETGRGIDAIDGLVATFSHDRDHYSRIIASLLPLMQVLSTGETGFTLSPDVDDLNDTREIWDIRSVIEKGAVLYIGSDSLANAEVSKAVNSMILADVASVAGHLYNFVKEKDRPEIFLMIDEVAEAINEQVIQILNKGRGAGFRAFVALQTIKDLEAKLQNAAKMLQVLGNLNNQIILRLEDVETVKWIVEKMGETTVKVYKNTLSQGTQSEAHIGEFSGQRGRSEDNEKVALVSKEIFLSLPNLQFVSRFTGGYISMGTIPIIKN